MARYAKIVNAETKGLGKGSVGGGIQRQAKIEKRGGGPSACARIVAVQMRWKGRKRQ